MMFKKIIGMGFISLMFYAINSQAAALPPEETKEQERIHRQFEEQEDADAIKKFQKDGDMHLRKQKANIVDPQPVPTRGLLGLVTSGGETISRPSSLARAMIVEDSEVEADFGTYAIRLLPEGIAFVEVKRVSTRYEFDPGTCMMHHTPMNLGTFLNMLVARLEPVKPDNDN